MSADDPAIQQLVYALKQAEAGSASGTPATTAAQFFANAKSAIATALTGLGSLTQTNGANEVSVNSALAVENQSIATMQSQLGNLTQVDPATVATQLSAIENQLNGSYKATSTILNLSILSFLP